MAQPPPDDFTEVEARRHAVLAPYLCAVYLTLALSSEVGAVPFLLGISILAFLTASAWLLARRSSTGVLTNSGLLGGFYLAGFICLWFGDFGCCA